jgi:hypothetical protein
MCTVSPQELHTYKTMEMQVRVMSNRLRKILPLLRRRITRVSDFIHRLDFNNYNKKNKHDLSETGSVSILRWGETPILLGPLERVTSITGQPCQSQSQSHVTTDGQSVGLSWCRAPSGAHDQILLLLESCSPVLLGRSLWRESGSVICPDNLVRNTKLYKHLRPGWVNES